MALLPFMFAGAIFLGRSALEAQAVILNSAARAKQYLLQKGYLYNPSDTCEAVEYFPGLFLCSTIALDEDPAMEFIT